MTKRIITSGSFDNLCSKQVRFLYEISKFGKVTLLLFSGEVIKYLKGSPAKFPLPERLYNLESIRYIDRVRIVTDISQLQNVSKIVDENVGGWFVLPSEETPQCQAYAKSQKITYQIISDEQLAGFPPQEIVLKPSTGKKVIVTGSFDWLHSGHIRFLEEASGYGDLYAVIGHDKNIEALKGPGHPMFSQNERRFMVESVRFVKQSLIASGSGWLDAEPEIHKIQPDIYVVNEDGDKEIKREFCRKNDIQYVVLKREPMPGLQRRTSTYLRGF
jgi:cytidyltransferase-like protein